MAVWIGAFLLAACSGPSTYTRPDPENCSDGIDNDGDGLVDCDDASDCGGLACRTTSVTTDTSPDLPDAEILFDDSTCCDFTFTQPDCQAAPQHRLSIGTIQFLNRSTTQEGSIDISCNDVGPNAVPAIKWAAEGNPLPQQIVINAPITQDSTLTMDAYFQCDPSITADFVTHCVTDIEVGTSKDHYEFDLSGSSG